VRSTDARVVGNRLISEAKGRGKTISAIYFPGEKERDRANPWRKPNHLPAPAPHTNAKERKKVPESCRRRLMRQQPLGGKEKPGIRATESNGTAVGRLVRFEGGGKGAR